MGQAAQDVWINLARRLVSGISVLHFPGCPVEVSRMSWVPIPEMDKKPEKQGYPG